MWFVCLSSCGRCVCVYSVKLSLCVPVHPTEKKRNRFLWPIIYLFEWFLFRLPFSHHPHTHTHATGCASVLVSLNDVRFRWNEFHIRSRLPIITPIPIEARSNRGVAIVWQWNPPKKICHRMHGDFICSNYIECRCVDFILSPDGGAMINSLCCVYIYIVQMGSVRCVRICSHSCVRACVCCDPDEDWRLNRNWFSFIWFDIYRYNTPYNWHTNTLKATCLPSTHGDRRRLLLLLFITVYIDEIFVWHRHRK